MEFFDRVVNRSSRRFERELSDDEAEEEVFEADDDHPSDAELPIFERDAKRKKRAALKKAHVIIERDVLIVNASSEVLPNSSFSNPETVRRYSEDVSSLSDNGSFATAAGSLSYDVGIGKHCSCTTYYLMRLYI
jgi:hypothetical protein